MRLLVVNVPYRSHYLADVTKKLVEQDFGGGELWTAEDLGSPVYSTEDGECPVILLECYLSVVSAGSEWCRLKTSLTAALRDQICTQSTHQTKQSASPVPQLITLTLFPVVSAAADW